MREFTIKSIITLSLLSLNITIFSQSFEPQSPLDIPLLLSGSYGELRSAHFHAGIDIKTNGKEGQNIRATESGYISRIVISTSNYGHALYITHLNGYTSVYGHLSEFAPKIDEYVREMQYKQKSFEVNLYPEKGKFVVVKGDIIALSGNTGSSGGPHLHFEIRDENQIPLNVLKFDLPIYDTIAPKFKNLFVYQNLNDDTFMYSSKDLYPIEYKNGEYIIGKTVAASKKVGFGVEVYDFLNGSSNKCGVYTLDLLVNDSLIYSMLIDRIGFDKAGYIKTHGDYAEKKINKRSVHRLFIEPFNKLDIYSTLSNGIVSITDDTTILKCKVIASDAYGNRSILSFNIESTDSSDSEIIGDIYLYADKEIEYKSENFKFITPSNSLYANKWINFTVFKDSINYLSDIYQIGDNQIPIHRYPTISININNEILNIPTSKLLIIRIEPDGKIVSCGGRYVDGWMETRMSSFGNYAILFDTIAPKIETLSFKKSGWYAANDVISFKISDDLSGINSYNGYIDDNWVLFEYEPKKDMIFYKVDASRLTNKGKSHTIKIIVTDDRNNIRSFVSDFKY